jgi:NADH-quinone oxidoreductase subunit N
MYMEQGPDMSKIREPKAILGVLVFGLVFMVAFGIWHAPLLEFATNSIPDLTQIVNSTQLPQINISG